MASPNWLDDITDAEWQDIERRAAFYREIGIDKDTLILSIVVRHDDPAGHLQINDPIRLLVGPGSTLSAELAVSEVLGLLRFCLFESGWALFTAGANLNTGLIENPEAIFDHFIPTASVGDDSQALN